MIGPRHQVWPLLAVGYGPTPTGSGSGGDYSDGGGGDCGDGGGGVLVYSARDLVGPLLASRQQHPAMEPAAPAGLLAKMELNIPPLFMRCA